MSTFANPCLTPEQYLEIERQADIKSEYYRGEMFAMSGGTSRHSRLTARLALLFGRQLEETDCTVYSSDLRVRVSQTGLYTYPDLSIVCGEVWLLDKERDTLLNPILLAEVLSPSTEAHDRGFKFEHYRSIPSLQHYLLVAQERMQVDLFTRDGARWALTSASQPEEKLQLEAIGCEILMSICTGILTLDRNV